MFVAISPELVRDYEDKMLALKSTRDVEAALSYQSDGPHVIDRLEPRRTGSG
jgi:hypothetical protein